MASRIKKISLVLEHLKLEYWLVRYTTLKTHRFQVISHFSLSLTRTYSHSHLHLNIQTPNPPTIGGRKPVGARRLSSAATSQLSHCLKRLKRRRCDHFRISMMPGEWNLGLHRRRRLREEEKGKWWLLERW